MAGLLWTQEDVPKVLKLGLLLAGLLFTHVLTPIIFVPVAAGFALYRGWRTFRGFLTAGFIALGLTAVYWLPLVAYVSFVCGSRWELDIGGTMFFPSLFSPSLEWSKPLVSDDVYNNRLLHIFFGFVLVYAIAILAAWDLKSDRQTGRNVIFWGAVIFGCLVMMLPISLPIYHIISPLRDIQYSWRFMTCATLAHSLLVAFLLDAFWKKAARDKLSGSRLWAGRVAGAAILVIALYLALVCGVKKYREAFFDNGKLQTTPIVTNVSARDANGEYIPIGANVDEARCLFPNKGSESLKPELFKGVGHVTGSQKSPRNWTIEIQATSPCLILIPQFWFPGWKASGLGSEEDFAVRSEAKSGLVQIEVPSGRHSIDLRLCALGPEIIGRLVSLGTACGLGLTAVFMVFKKRVRQEAINIR
jgi:hypothetical protein